MSVICSTTSSAVLFGKGIDLLSEVALTEEAQYEEVCQKSLRDFHKTHPSGSGTVTKTALSAAKIKPSVTNEGTGVKPGVPDVTEEESFECEAESWGIDEDDNNNEQDSKSERKEDEDDEEKEEDEFVKTSSNDSDDEDEAKITDKAKGDEDEEMDYTSSQLYDDVDIQQNKPVQADDETIQKEGTDAELTNIQQGNENPEISQVIEDAYVTLSTVPQKTEVLVNGSSHSSDLASKFLNFSDIPHTYVEIVSAMDVHVHHEVPSQQTLTLLTVPVSVITDSSPILPKEVSNFAPPEIQRMVTKSLEESILTKESSQPQSSYKAAATITKFELEKILIDKIDKSESYLAAPEHRECYDGLRKSYDLDKTLLSTYGKVYSLKRSRKDKDKDEDPSTGSDRELNKRKTSKDAELMKGSKAKESQSDSSKGTKSQPKSSRKSVQLEVPEFEVADSDMP
ncbi:hypothetical protein Tco_0226314 [Tanacetum coccineum]